VFSTLTQRYWLPGLNAVVGRQSKGLRAWVVDDDYQVLVPITSDGAVLRIAHAERLLCAFAGDVSRMASASFESIEGIAPSRSLPRSTAWLVIRTYYAAFFAAHALLRMLGTSVTQFDAPQLGSVHEVADAYSMKHGIALSRGQYVCRFDAASSELRCRRVDGDRAHAGLWRVLLEELRRISADLLSTNVSSVAVQSVAAQMDTLATCLSRGGLDATGAWLSSIRNMTNYQHEFGAWYPYSDRPRYYERLYDIAAKWKQDPGRITLWTQPGRDLQRFVESCVLIVSLCRDSCAEMSRRCPGGRSFHEMSSLALLRHL
jgi:hypothetical protein